MVSARSAKPARNTVVEAATASAHAERKKARAYFALLGAQTVVVGWLFWFAVPIFRQYIANIGRIQDLDLFDEAAIAGGCITLQALYWTRMRFVPLWTRGRSIFLGHVVRFASRVSFFFGGAMFSTIFFRHIPELEVLPPIGQGLVRAMFVLAVLFSLFCYSLELERFGAAIEAPLQDQ